MFASPVFLLIVGALTGCMGQQLLPFGLSVGDELVPPALDGSTTPQSKAALFDIACPFFGVEETILHVNTNGVLSFRAPFLDFFPLPFPLAENDTLIAPFWNDYDVTQGGDILFRFSNDEALLSAVGSSINDAFLSNFSPQVLFIATWDGVPLLTSAGISNTFQVVLATDGSSTFVLFLYEDIEAENILGTTIGFNAGDGARFFTLPESLFEVDVLNLESTSNVGIPGTYIFRVDQSEVILPPGPNVSLVVVDAELSVTEPDPGDSSSITQCFTADLIEPLDSDAFIPLILSTASTTATQSADFLLNTSVLILPANFTGEFITCVEFEVFSDEIAEGNETIVFEASSQVTSSFVINILDNEDIGNLLPFGVNVGDQTVVGDDANSAPQSKLAFANVTCPFFGTEESLLFVNTNGVLSFRSPFTDFFAVPFPLPTNDVLIAPFWDDFDVSQGGQILFRQTSDQVLLDTVGSIINDHGNFTPTFLLIATWDNVPEFGSPSNVTNSFQVILATDGNKTYVVFLYQDIQWGSSFTTIGFNAGDGLRAFTLSESVTTEGVLGLESASNVGVPGVFVLRVDQAIPQGSNVSVVAMDAEQSVTELDQGNSSLIPVCFTVGVTQPLDSDTVIQLVPSAVSTAILGLDFLLNTSFIIVPANFSGEFITCVDVEIIGDNLVEGNERISYDLSSGVTDAFLINILDNDEIVGNFLPFGLNVGDQSVFGDDASSGPQSKLAFANVVCPFLGTEESVLFVNTNGILSFRSPFTDATPVPFPLPTNDVLIAPFWDDFDVSQGGQILFRQTSDEDLLNTVGSIINDHTNFTPTLLLIATWDSVPEFGSPSDVLNTLQVILATDGSKTYVVFLYQDIQWGSSSTTIGFNAGDGLRAFTLAESLTTEGVLNLESASNVGVPGVFVMRADQPLSGPMIVANGDPHFSVLLPTGQLLCYTIQGEHGLIFNLIANDLMQVNALFVPDAIRSEVTWIGELGIIVKGARYKTLNDTKLRFSAKEKRVYLGEGITLAAERVEMIHLANGKLTLVETEKKSSLTEVDVFLEDVGLGFSVRFVKGSHLDMVWKKVSQQPHSHGLIGQFLRSGVEVDESRRILLLPDMEPVPVMRKPVWHFMERDDPDEQLCWVSMNPGYQGKRLIQGHYLDYLVGGVLSNGFVFVEK